MPEDKPVSKRVYIHQPSNPPAPGYGADIELTIERQHHLSATDWNKGQHPSFKLVVAKPKLLGLPSYEQSNRNEFIERVILACNLTLYEAALSTSRADTQDAGVERRSGPSTVKIEQTADEAAVGVGDTLSLGDSALGMAHHRCLLYEDRALAALRKVQAVFNVGGTADPKNFYLRKSLDEYRRATMEVDALDAFRGLYDALVSAVNYDNAGLVGEDLDKEVSRIAGYSTRDVEELRRFNNGLKHTSDRSLRAAYEKGMKELPRYVNELRGIAAKVILDRIR